MIENVMRRWKDAEKARINDTKKMDNGIKQLLKHEKGRGKPSDYSRHNNNTKNKFMLIHIPGVDKRREKENRL